MSSFRHGRAEASIPGHHPSSVFSAERGVGHPSDGLYRCNVCCLNSQFAQLLSLSFLFFFFFGCHSLPAVPAGTPSRGGDVAVFDKNRPSLPTPFYSVLVSVSVFMALSTVFYSINLFFFFCLLVLSSELFPENSSVNRGNTEGTNSSKILCSMFVYVLFYVNLCRGLILWFFE